MAQPPPADSPQILLHMLCNKITGLKDEALTPHYKMALQILSGPISTPQQSDEFQIVEKIKKKMVKLGRVQDCAIFAELHRKLQGQDILRDRWAVLYLLYCLNGDKSGQSKHLTFALGATNRVTSTPFSTDHRGTQVTPVGNMPTLQSVSSGGTSGISSIPQSAYSSEQSSLQPMSLPPSALRQYSLHQLQQTLQHGGSVGRLGLTGGKSSPSSVVTVNGDKRNLSARSASRSAENTSYEVPETILLREILYAFQGIDGKYIKYDMARDTFKIDSEAGISRSTRQMLLKLAECGWLYMKVRKYAETRSTDRAFGLIGQSFCTALHQELMDYYRLIAVLEAQLQQQEDMSSQSMPSGGSLTLRRLAVWTCDPLLRLKTLAALVDICQVTPVAQPIFSTIISWIYDGELEDTYHEFFVASDPTVKDDRLWHDKYSLRKSMIPSFLTMNQANKILLTGKSINFLHHICDDRTTVRTRDIVKAAETHHVESIFSQTLDGHFQKMIDTVYLETSKHLLEVLHLKYKFMDHLKAMRRYLLLGQGDFIRHLMDLLEDDLMKPATTLYLHKLTGILDQAIRATNAQYDDIDILKRTDVRLLEVSPGDTGWDVFSLDYHVDGPIRTVFTPECIIMYLRVFNFLWRAKRMEYILSGLWRSQNHHAHLLRSLPEVTPVLHQCHMIVAEMVHFVQQVQYYINFEVLECSWDELLQKVREAQDLDHIIAAHEMFLDTIITRSLLDSQSTVSPPLSGERVIQGGGFIKEKVTQVNWYYGKKLLRKCASVGGCCLDKGPIENIASSERLTLREGRSYSERVRFRESGRVVAATRGRCFPRVYG
ncbi:hypothetical protein NP493_1211g00044 [Ridgeia piscesae]|uniref:Gamma-tubulin complex component n=1 Tax=Ridgeia piscesae TaxID=27915 RepID=A0AAD9NG70_RIDPI|nr:hypothetical protein NP493_1211g00044 [Ridgeia piscesae]